MWNFNYKGLYNRGVGTATAGAALAVPLFSIKKQNKTKQNKKTEIRMHLQDWRIGKLNNFLVNITQPIL